MELMNSCATEAAGLLAAQRLAVGIVPPDIHDLTYPLTHGLPGCIIIRREPLASPIAAPSPEISPGRLPRCSQTSSCWPAPSRTYAIEP
jgi:hypothetical protein